MMTRFSAVLVAASLMTILTACDMTRPVDLDLPPFEPAIVVGGFVAADEPVEVRFGLSEDVLAPYDTARARVLAGVVLAAIYDGDGQFLDSLRYDLEGDGLRPIYRSDVRPAPGSTVELRASAPGVQSVRAVAVVPNLPVVRVRSVASGPDGFDRYEVTWPPSEIGAPYHIALTRAQDGTRVRFDSPSLELRASFESIDEPVDEDPSLGGARSYFGEAVLRAASNPFAIDLRIPPNRFDNQPPSARLHVTAVSDDFARYHQSVEVQERTVRDPFVEPTAVYSNVDGGLGAFVGFATTTVSL